MSESDLENKTNMKKWGNYNIEPVNRNNDDIDDDEDDDEDDDDDDDDDDDVQAQPLPGGYDPHEYEQLAAPKEIKELFQYITRYSPQLIELQRKLKPFIPEYVPAVGDIDAFIKVQHPSNSQSQSAGLLVLDEPCINQSDPIVLQLKLRALSKEAYKGTMIIKKVQNIYKHRKTIHQWIKDINNIHKNKHPSTFHYSTPMPDIDTLLQECSPDFEERLSRLNFPIAELNVDLFTYIDIICALLDIPRYENKSRIESLHLLFSLYLAIKSSSKIISEPPTFYNKIDEQNIGKYVSDDVLKYMLDFETSNLESKAPKLSAEEETRLLRKQAKEHWVEPNVEKVIERILLGQPYTLEQFKSFSTKKQLLKRAVEIGDGNALLSIVVFLSKSLKKTLFCQLLREHPSAMAHYTHHLFIRREMQELNDILEMLGETKDFWMKQLSVISHNPNKVLNKLRVYQKNNMLDGMDRQLIEDYLKLIEWQTEASRITGDESIVGNSAVETLEYAIKHNLPAKLNGTGNISGVNSKDSMAVQLAKEFKICDKQYLAASIRAYSELKDWQVVEKLLVTKGWIGGEKLDTSLPMDKVLFDMKSKEAPTDLLDRLLMLLDVDERLEIGTKLDRHTVVIDSWVKKRDKQGLLRYIATLQMQSAEYLYAENFLKNPNLKWKN